MRLQILIGYPVRNGGRPYGVEESKYPGALRFEVGGMEAKLKHLEFIQAAIGRMATNSSLFKGWAVTIAAGLGAFATVSTKGTVFAIALISTLMFWALDGYYLWLERGYVELHKSVAAKSADDIDFSMAIDKSGAARKWFLTCWRPHLWLFYGTILVVEVLGIVFITRSK